MPSLSRLSYHARQRLAERTTLCPEWVDSVLRQGKTVNIRQTMSGRLHYLLLYAVTEESFYVLPEDTHKNRICTVLPLSMYLPRAPLNSLTEAHYFQARACFVPPGPAVSPITGNPVSIRLVAYVLDDRNALRALSLGRRQYPSPDANLAELGSREEFIEELLERVRGRGVNPARVASFYGEQSKKLGPVLIRDLTPNPWAPMYLDEHSEAKSPAVA